MGKSLLRPGSRPPAGEVCSDELEARWLGGWAGGLAEKATKRLAQLGGLRRLHLQV